MLRVLLADDHHAALAADDGAITADFFDGRANFHVSVLEQICRVGLSQAMSCEGLERAKA
jgi:hypothetical protein